MDTSRKDFSPRMGSLGAAGAALLSVVLGAAALAGAARPPAGNATKTSPAAAVVPVQITVTELPEHGGQVPPIAMSDVTVAQGHTRDDVVSWVPAQGAQAGLQLLILLDDSDHIGRVADQLTDLRAFILQQPATTQIGIGYLYSGLVHMEQDFTSDHNLAAKAVHISASTGTASPYFSLMDLYKQGKWHVNPNYPRREILLLTDGDDPYSGPFIEDPYVEDCIADMQRAGIEVFSIFTPGKDTEDSGYRGGTLLDEMDDPTGGYSLYSGLTGTLVSFTPFLDDLNYILGHQYLLTFDVHPERKENLVAVKVAAANIPSNKLIAPAKVYVPGQD